MAEIAIRLRQAVTQSSDRRIAALFVGILGSGLCWWSNFIGNLWGGVIDGTAVLFLLPAVVVLWYFAITFARAMKPARGFLTAAAVLTLLAPLSFFAQRSSSVVRDSSVAHAVRPASSWVQDPSLSGSQFIDLDTTTN